MHRVAEQVVMGVQDAVGQLSLIAETVAEEVAFGPANLGLPRDEYRGTGSVRTRAHGDRGPGPTPPTRLSGGQQQLVVLAGLLAMRPRHLVLDEPLAHLDAASARLVLRAIRAAADDGMAVLVVEQRVAELSTIADAVLVIGAGNIVARGAPADVLGDPSITALGVGRDARGRAASQAAPKPGWTHRWWSHRRDRAAPRRRDLRLPRRHSWTRRHRPRHRAGTALGLIGANGSGKTTLARQLDGLLRPSHGRVLLDGTDTAGLRVSELARSVGLGFQLPDRQIFSSTVRDEVEFGPRHAGLETQPAFARMTAALERVGLSDQLGTHPGDLGESQRKLLTMASVLAMETPIVVLDEPTTGLDARGVALVARIIGELAEEGRAVVGISHDTQFVAETFDRIVVLDGGRLVLEGAPADVFAEQAWPTLRSAGLEPPAAALIGARLGLGSTPTDAALIAALQARP